MKEQKKEMHKQYYHLWIIDERVILYTYNREEMIKLNNTTWINCTPSSAQEQAYNALQQAAERMGKNSYSSQYNQHIKSGRSKNTFRFSVTGEHALVVEYMPKVLSGEVSPEDAFVLLHNYDVMNQRLNI